MNFLPVYFDASALLKLVVTENESSALTDAIERWPDRVSASIVRVEMHRALRRAGRPKAAYDLADAVLTGVVMIRVDEPVLAYAARLSNPHLRALDAIHLAAALTIGDDPEAFVTYDARLARAARQEGLTVLHPGVKVLRN